MPDTETRTPNPPDGGSLGEARTEIARLREEVAELRSCDCASREDGNPHHQGFCRSLPTSVKRARHKRFAECYSVLAADTRNVNDLARKLADAHDETAAARAEVEDWRDKWAIVDEDRCEAQAERDAARAEADAANTAIARIEAERDQARRRLLEQAHTFSAEHRNRLLDQLADLSNARDAALELLDRADECGDSVTAELVWDLRAALSVSGSPQESADE